MEYLVLGPAGMGIFILVGSLMKYEDMIKNVKEISGASAGAIVAVALALDIPLHDILDRLLSLDIENLTKFKLKSFMKNYGFIVMKPLRDALEKAYGSDPTFSELSKKVYISAYCVNRARTEYFSVDTHPHMKVIDAVCMSMAIPFIFETIKYNDMLYMDGGTKELYPYGPFINKNPEKIMCIRLKQNDIFLDKISNVKQFLKGVLLSLSKSNDNDTIKFGKTIYLDIDLEQCLQFSMSHEDKLRLFLKGLNS